MRFIGPLGLSIAINGGVCRPFRTTDLNHPTEKIRNSGDMQLSSLPVPQQ
jgi:hypothetical protein